ncbi:tetratricopeptide repeat protein [Streptomyces sp. NPDC051366]|uniref:tetratricopeptide repeat protein n=1 Tax=Streptomyces sp. NPDC051366 TaxID=3365652 RepID=UPI0037B0AB30
MGVRPPALSGVAARISVPPYSTRCDRVKRRRWWAGIAGVAAACAGVAVWAVQSHWAAAPESKSPPVNLKAQEANALLRGALVQESQHDSKGAARTFRRVVELDPRNKLAWYNLGVIAQQDGKAADALASYDKALKIDPSFTSALFNEAILLKPTEPDRAAGLLKRAIAADPKAATAHLHLGHILADQGRTDEAGGAFRRAVAADPSLRSQVPEQFRDFASPSPTSTPAGSTR